MNTFRSRRQGRRFSQRMDSLTRHAGLSEAIDQAIDDIGIHRSGDARLKRTSETPIYQLRRRSFRPEDDRTGTITLVDRDGVLGWENASVVSSYARDRRMRRAGGGYGEVVEQLRFETLDKSEIGRYLQKLDSKFNPRLRDAPEKNLLTLTPKIELSREAVRPSQRGRILLFVHGTFSHSSNLRSALTTTEEGRRFLHQARSSYDQILFYDHSTLHVSPVINAIDLERLMRTSQANIDIVAHSRGGLVVRWWLEALERDLNRIGRVVLVGSPLAGTSLAAPPKLKRAMEMLTNIFSVLSHASMLAQQVAPFMIVITGLLRVLSSASKVVARTPIADAAVATVPGLVAMSRVGDNPEILRLRRGRVPLEASYYAIMSNFEPEGPGWRFWRFFTQKEHMADFGADLIFESDNDLVVDKNSMADLKGTLGHADVRRENILDFGTSSTVHHLNYFHQKETIKFLTKTLARK